MNNYLLIEPTYFPFCRVNMERPPRVSFCIPTLNNEDTIGACLDSIASQDYPDIEIIIVDGGSKDKTVEISRQFTQKIYYDYGKLGSARQTSVENSTGEILGLFDSDIVIPHRGWLRNAIKYFNCDENISTVWPSNIAPPNASYTSRLYFNQWKKIFEKRMSKQYGLFGGGNALFRKDCIERIGGINPSLHWGEDFDWAMKLRDQGYAVAFINDPLYHDTMKNLGEFVRKQFTGAKTFTQTGFELMGMSTKDIILEQIDLGTKDTIKGLFYDKDSSWLLSPIFLTTRGIAYCITYLRKKALVIE